MADLFSDTSRFWVIFDSCTVPDYYLDVHKLLAFPKDATIRYNYREKYLSPPAVTASLNPAAAPKFGLVLYAQRNGFHKGDGTPATGTIFADMLWLPTRIVEMLCIPARDGETFNYDLKVLRYPSIDRAAMTRILSPLIQRNEIPFNKWVTISSELASFQELQKGEDRRNWGTIVTEFHRPEFQFSSDVFWRIVGPTRGRTSRLVSPRYEQILESGAPRLVKAVYDLEEGQNHSFEIVSASPPRPQGTDLTQYSIKCTSTNDKNVEINGSGIVSLRQETADSVQFVGKITEEIADHSAALRFQTQPKPKDWPGGPELEVLVAVVKSKTKMVLGLILGLFGLLLGAYGAEVLKSSALIGIPCLAIGIILVVISGLLIFKKLSLKS
jgi:hypothetical protein